MQNISSVVGKLLFFARHLGQSKQINSQQLASLKDMILSDNQDVHLAFQEYLSQGTELTLASSLIRLIQKDSESEGQKQNSVSSDSKKPKSRKNSIKVIIPKRNIQKMPAGMGRI